jgi:hypothetical protein
MGNVYQFRMVRIRKITVMVLSVLCSVLVIIVMVLVVVSTDLQLIFAKTLNRKSIAVIGVQNVEEPSTIRRVYSTVLGVHFSVLVMKYGAVGTG